MTRHPHLRPTVLATPLRPSIQTAHWDCVELRELERAVGQTLAHAASGCDFTDPVLRRAVTILGTVARARGVSADELLARLDALVCATLGSLLGASATDAVLVYLWRFARHAHDGGPPPSAAAARAVTERIDRMNGMNRMHTPTANK